VGEPHHLLESLARPQVEKKHACAHGAVKRVRSRLTTSSNPPTCFPVPTAGFGSRITGRGRARGSRRELSAPARTPDGDASSSVEHFTGFVEDGPGRAWRGPLSSSEGPSGRPEARREVRGFGLGIRWDRFARQCAARTHRRPEVGHDEIGWKRKTSGLDLLEGRLQGLDAVVAHDRVVARFHEELRPEELPPVGSAKSVDDEDGRALEQDKARSKAAGAVRQMPTKGICT